MQITLSPLQIKDIDRVMQIERISFIESVVESAGVYEQRFRVFKEGNLGYFYDGTLIGFFCSELWKYEVEYSLSRFSLDHDISEYHDQKGTELYISSFAVDKRYRDRLRGKTAFALGMKHMCESFQIKSAILLVAERWIAARNIYTQWGFKDIRWIEHFFENGAGIIMRTGIPG